MTRPLIDPDVSGRGSAGRLFIRLAMSEGVTIDKRRFVTSVPALTVTVGPSTVAAAMTFSRSAIGPASENCDGATAKA